MFDFDAKAAGTTEKKLQMNDAVSNLNVVCDASSRKLLRNGQFPHRVMGTALFEVGEILGSRGNVGSKSLQTGGAVYAHIERCRDDGLKGKFKFQLRALRLKNVYGITGTSSPCFELLRKVDRPTGATWYVTFFTSHHIINDGEELFDAQTKNQPQKRNQKTSTHIAIQCLRFCIVFLPSFLPDDVSTGSKCTSQM